MTNLEILSRLKDLLIHKNWCQNFSALDKKRKPTYPWFDDARYFCLVGGCYHIAEDNDDYNSALDLMTRAVKKMGYLSVAEFNDSRKTKKKDVLNFLDNLIEKLR